MTKQNYQLLNWSLLTDEIFQVHSENWLVANLLVVDFFFSAMRNAIINATKYVTYSFSFRNLVFFPFQESLNVNVCKRYRFFSVLPAIIQKNSDK